MANEDDTKGTTATGSWVGKGTGAGATPQDQSRQSFGTAGGGAGGVAAESGLRPESTDTASYASTGTDESHEGRAMQHWDTSANPLIASNRVEGTAVYSHDRDRLGTIQHIMIDKLSGQSEFAVMSFGGFLGIGSDYYPIPWNKLTYDTEVGGYVVDITQDQLSGAPRYAADDEPDYGTDYTGQVGRYYGL